MKVLVTGGSGFIGSHLVRFLIKEKECKVMNFDSLSYAVSHESLRDIETNPCYTFLKGDLCDLGDLKSAFSQFSPDCVMHLAAETHVDRSINNPGPFIQSNVVGTFNLLEETLRYWRSLEKKAQVKFRLLHVSTDEVYGALNESDPGFIESSNYSPRSPYSASKAASDHLVRAWGNTYGLPVIVTHSSNNYGPYQHPEKLIPKVILNALKGESIPIYSKGENIRDWLYVEDHVNALYEVITRGGVGESYNIGGNNERKNIDLVRTLCRLMDELKPGVEPYEHLITFVTDRPGHDLRYAIDRTKIKQELNWEPKESLDNGLRKTVKWYLEN